MFKVMTYNIQHGIDYIHRLSTSNVRIDLLKIASIIKDTNASIISLNEVYDAPVKDLDKQAIFIASKLGFNYVFGKAIDIRGGEYGNALLSKYPILDKYIKPFIGAREFLHDKMGSYSRYCLWFKGGNPSDYNKIKEITERFSLKTVKILPPST